MKIKINKSMFLLLTMGFATANVAALEPISVSASADDGNVAENTLDDSLNTRWSSKGEGEWVAYELGTDNYLVEDLEIAFYKGNERTANFDVQLSDDGNNWTTVWSGDQPSSTLSLQTIAINEEGSHLRILGYGNNVNTWNSITEVNIVASISDGDGIVSPLDTVPAINCTVEVSSVDDLESNTGWSVSSGTTICLTDGTYNDVELSIGGTGTETLPITVAAKNPGKVFFEGDSQVRMSGSYVVVQGITFQNGNSSSSDLFQTRGAGDLACNYCRITENTITNWDQSFEDSNRWFLIYGQHNRIDHNWFSGKSNRGALLTVDRGVIDADYAQIDHNYFGDRPPINGQEFPSTSDNEYEAIRIGTSGTHQAGSYTRVEYNYFERIQGEAEIISNKSSFNVISHNTIRDSYGSIVARHGSDAKISHNFMFADGYEYAGGIRLADANHEVFNNYIEGCSFTDSNFNGGIVLTDSDGTSDSGYQQVDNVFIAHNTIVDCVNSINFAGGKTAATSSPTNVTMINNVVSNATGSVFVNMAEGIPTGSVFAGNYVYGDSFSDDSSVTSITGFTFIDPLLVEGSDGISRPSFNSSALSGGSNNFGTFAAIDVDMDGQTRKTTNPDSGADEVTSGDITKEPLTSNDVGPKNYRP